MSYVYIISYKGRCAGAANGLLGQQMALKNDRCAFAAPGKKEI